MVKHIQTTHQPSASPDRLIEMGVFSVPHGVRGQIKLRSFTEIPEDIAGYSPLQDSKGHCYRLAVEGHAGNMLIVSVDGVSDRNAAEKLKNITLYVPRSALPKLRKGEYYHEDLVGLKLSTADGTAFGEILSVHNFGAGTLVNIRLARGGEEYLPFNPAVFPEIDIEKKSAVIAPPQIISSIAPDDE